MGTRVTYEPLQAAPLSRQLSDQIKQRIFRGELPEGERLPIEPELAVEFGVSRTVVREAMKRLEQEGFVQVQRGRGTFVVYRAGEAVSQSLENFVEAQRGDKWQALLEVRELLEPGIAYWAALRAGDEQLAVLRTAVATMDKSLRDADAYIDADSAFHVALARAAGNDLLLTLLEPLMSLLAAQRKELFATPAGPENGQYHHKRILAAVEARDGKAARQFMDEHMQQVRQDMHA